MQCPLWSAGNAAALHDSQGVWLRICTRTRLSVFLCMSAAVFTQV